MSGQYAQSFVAAVSNRANRHQHLAELARSDASLRTLGYTIATLFVFLGILDVLSTNWALSVGAYEVNALIRSAQHSLGSFWYVPKLLMQALIAAMVVWSPNRITLIMMTAICGWTASVVASNFTIAYVLSMM